MDSGTKFRAVNGNFRTQSLMLELSYTDPEWSIYTLKDEDYEYKGKIMKSLRRLYIECNDPTEYKFANKCFESWTHWQRIVSSCGDLKPYIEKWRDELEVKLRSEGIVGVMNEVKVGGKGALQASKWLADRGWSDKKAGRPKKEEREKQSRINKELKEAVDNDRDRIRAVK